MTGTIRSADMKRRNARQTAHSARATPARCTTANATCTPGDNPVKLAPYTMRMPWMVTMRWAGMAPTGASVVGSGRPVYPPRCLIALTTSAAAPNERMPAAIREYSYHREASRLPSWA